MSRYKTRIGRGAPKRPADPPPTIRMRAQVRFDYADRTREPGDEFEAEAQHVHLLTVIGHAALVTGAGTYRRLDLVADEPS